MLKLLCAGLEGMGRGSWGISEGGTSVSGEETCRNRVDKN